MPPEDSTAESRRSDALRGIALLWHRSAGARPPSMAGVLLVRVGPWGGPPPPLAGRRRAGGREEKRNEERIMAAGQSCLCPAPVLPISLRKIGRTEAGQSCPASVLPLSCLRISLRKYAGQRLCPAAIILSSCMFSLFSFFFSSLSPSGRPPTPPCWPELQGDPPPPMWDATKTTPDLAKFRSVHVIS